VLHNLLALKTHLEQQQGKVEERRQEQEQGQHCRISCLKWC
jgi:hypothetical protein